MRPELDLASQFLWSAQEARAETRRRHLRVQELEARCASITAKMNGMPGGGGDRHSLEQAYIALAEERDIELQAIRDEQRKYHEVEDAIAQLSSPEQRAVLRHRYLRGISWNSIPREMARDNYHYSDRHIYRFHEDALYEIYAMLSKGVMANEIPAEAAPELLHRPADEAGEA